MIYLLNKYVEVLKIRRIALMIPPFFARNPPEMPEVKFNNSVYLICKLINIFLLTDYYIKNNKFCNKKKYTLTFLFVPNRNFATDHSY